jgi:hypothetical protein
MLARIAMNGCGFALCVMILIAAPGALATTQKSYTLKRLNNLQVFIAPSDAGSTTYELIGCPT